MISYIKTEILCRSEKKKGGSKCSNKIGEQKWDYGIQKFQLLYGGLPKNANIDGIKRPAKALNARRGMI
jgi:hypothetical protein